jgi:hypothetical protein
MNLFIDPKQLIQFDIFVGVSESGVLVVGDSKEKVMDDKTVKPDAIISYSFSFRTPNYKDDVTLLSSSVTSNGANFNVDTGKLRYERFCSLIESWTITDHESKLVECTRENIDKLNSTFANAIVSALEERL